MKVYIIAGEASGDLLGGQVMAALKNFKADLQFGGVGGPSMEHEGLTSLFPLQYLSVMGLIEIIPHLPRIFRCLHQVVQDIHRFKPDIILTIDAPAFTYRVAKKVKPLGIPLFHLTAPTVWAWRPKRAKAMARIYDHLFCLFPFEPAYFEKEGLASTFVGHPLVDLLRPYEKPYNPEGPLVLLPGSRKGELQVFVPLFKKLLERYPQSSSTLVVTLPHYRSFIEKAFSSYKVTVLTEAQEKYEAMAKARLALAASGTVSLELGLLGTPMIIGYHLHPLTAWIAKKLIRIPFVCLVNILLGKSVVPELLQDKCTPQDFEAAIKEGSWRSQLPCLQSLKSLLQGQENFATLVARTLLKER